MPVEDAVVLVYQDRYIYLVSGWHDQHNAMGTGHALAGCAGVWAFRWH